MKKTISILLTLLIFLFAGISAPAKTNTVEYDATGEKVCTNPADIFNFVLCDGHKAAPIRIVKASLSQNGSSNDVYLVGLVGIEMNPKQENVVRNAFPAAFSIENGYTRLIKKTLFENIPQGSDIVFAGHSLGGMCAQIVNADNEVKSAYNIVATLTAGSPYIIVKDREGILNRICDVYDIVPYLSAATFVMPSTQIKTQIRENAGFVMNPDKAHNISYRLERVWGAYDALGFKNGDAKISFDFDDLTTFGSNLGPIIAF
ncbi:MAG: hypothetical protein K6B52_01505 [Clostridiales bacterium]|nr:hypothetical protein [Clostridiales bacterium]